MDRLRIRDARADDRGAIEAVTLAAYEQYSALMPAHWEVYRQNILATLAAARPEVRLLAVAPAARGQGVAAALMDESVRRARRSGATALTLHTTEMMQAAVRLYERMGFERAPELDFQPVPGVIIKGYRLGLEETHS